MKKFLFLGAAAALTLASCSNEEVVNQAPAAKSDVISFAAQTPGMSRASALYCSNNGFDKFNVFATVGTGTDMQVLIYDDVVSKSGNAWTTTTTHFWPENGDVKFYGIVNGELEDIKTTPKTKTFTVNNSVANQKDLMYAVETASKATATDGKVTLNFRHALTQLTFAAGIADDANIKVTVKSVKVANVSGSGVYTLPEGNTTDNIAHADNHNGAKTEGTEYERGTWGSYGSTASYTVEVATDKQALSTTAHSLTPNVADAMLLIPNDKLTAWNGNSKLSEAGGTAFVLDVVITNKGNANEDAVEIYRGEIAVPVTVSTWAQGVRYAYTFTFGENGTGVNPDDPTNPILVKVAYDCTIDEFIATESETVEF